MKTQTTSIAPQLPTKNHQTTKPVVLRMNVSEDRLEDNIITSFTLVKNLGRELDITFTSERGPEM